MNILTISASPFLNTKLGTINSSILEYLKKQGHQVSSSVWHHDSEYFMPDDEGIFWYEVDDKKICQLHLFENNAESSVQIYEIMKKVGPQVVITIGDYYETYFIYALKRMYPNLFKWVAILTIAATPINEAYKESLEYIDYAIVTSECGKKSFEELTEGNIPCDLKYFGPDIENSFYTGVKSTHSFKNDVFRILNIGKNSQSSNIAAFIKAAGIFCCSSCGDSKAYLHTNIDDEGDYDIDLLLKRYDKRKYIDLPVEYVSIKDGISEEELYQEYQKSSVIIDCSLCSATATSVLEAMSFGCIPLVSDIGAIGEIAKKVSNNKYFETSNIFWGETGNMFLMLGTHFVSEREEVLNIVSDCSILNNLEKIYWLWKEKPKEFVKIQSICIKVALEINRGRFLENLEEVISNVMKNKEQILVLDNCSL